MENPTKITVTTTVNAPLSKVWECWKEPAHIIKWNYASPDWHTPYAENDLTEGSRFKSTMAAKDGSMSFDFEGTYTEIIPNQLIAYTLDDNRKVKIEFTSQGNSTTITETFDAESINPIEMQQAGWQAILNNFKKHVEEN